MNLSPKMEGWTGPTNNVPDKTITWLTILVWSWSPPILLYKLRSEGRWRRVWEILPCRSRKSGKYTASSWADNLKKTCLPSARKSQSFLWADGRHITFLGRPVAMFTQLQHIKMLMKASLLPGEAWKSGSFYHQFMVYSCVSIVVYRMSLILFQDSNSCLIS